jgi:hypothetical protein
MNEVLPIDAIKWRMLEVKIDKTLARLRFCGFDFRCLCLLAEPLQNLICTV